MVADGFLLLDCDLSPYSFLWNENGLLNNRRKIRGLSELCFIDSDENSVGQLEERLFNFLFRISKVEFNQNWLLLDFDRDNLNKFVPIGLQAVQIWEKLIFSVFANCDFFGTIHLLVILVYCYFDVSLPVVFLLEFSFGGFLNNI